MGSTSSIDQPHYSPANFTGQPVANNSNKGLVIRGKMTERQRAASFFNFLVVLAGTTMASNSMIIKIIPLIKLRLLLINKNKKI
jgi:hypothetical protein